VNHLGVDVRFNHYAEGEEVITEQPDAVFVATGGWPSALDIPGSQYLASSWDILSGEVRASGEVLVLDEVGDHAASVCADVLSQAGCQVTLMTPDRAVAHDLGPTNSAVVLRDLAKQKVSFECFLDLKAVEKVNGRLQVTLQHTLTGETSRREYDYVVVENGVVPMDDLYYELKPHSSNLGQLDHVAMIAGESPFVSANAEGGFVLARLGDTVAGRNIHAAVYDALRVCKSV
jgi:pyruvate/2-oxoglutarate dehydrogenase complex dihydrolipoamide dehydrogenase (E3) component